MVEVFKTNVCNPRDANMIVVAIQQVFAGFRVNFDLQDCDHILRVESCSEKVQPGIIIRLLSEYGFHAELLPDEIPLSRLIKAN